MPYSSYRRRYKDRSLISQYVNTFLGYPYHYKCGLVVAILAFIYALLSTLSVIQSTDPSQPYTHRPYMPHGHICELAPEVRKCLNDHQTFARERTIRDFGKDIKDCEMFLARTGGPNWHCEQAEGVKGICHYRGPPMMNMVHPDASDFGCMPKRMPRVLVLGEVGVGKSALLNKLGGVRAEVDLNSDDFEIKWQDRQVFASDDTMTSVTDMTAWAVVNFLGEPRKRFLVMDTQGVNDKNPRQNKLHAADLFLKLRAMEYLNMIVIVLKPTVHNRFSEPLRILIQGITDMFANNKHDNVWNHIVLAYTQCDSFDSSWKIRRNQKILELKTYIKLHYSNGVEVPVVKLSNVQARGERGWSQESEFRVLEDMIFNRYRTQLDTKDVKERKDLRMQIDDLRLQYAAQDRLFVKMKQEHVKEKGRLQHKYEGELKRIRASRAKERKALEDRIKKQNKKADSGKSNLDQLKEKFAATGDQKYKLLIEAAEAKLRKLKQDKDKSESEAKRLRSVVDSEINNMKSRFTSNQSRLKQQQERELKQMKKRAKRKVTECRRWWGFCSWDK